MSAGQLPWSCQRFMRCTGTDGRVRYEQHDNCGDDTADHGEEPYLKASALLLAPPPSTPCGEDGDEMIADVPVCALSRRMGEPETCQSR